MRRPFSALRVPASGVRLAAVGILLLLSSSATAPRAQQRGPAVERIGGRDAAAGRLIVKFRPSAARRDVLDVEGEADADSDRLIGNGLARVIHSRSRRVADLLATVGRHPQVEYVEPDYLVHIVETPNDPAFADQWGLNNTGQTVNGTTGTPGADVHAAEAWDIARGSANVVIGIIDGAFDSTHFDLAQNVWSAPRAFTVQIGGESVTCPAGTHGALFQSSVLCDPLYNGPHEHATHVAGIAGAAGDDGQGMTGANWHTSLMSLSFMPDGSTGYTSDAVNAIEFAIQVKGTFAGSAAGNVRVLNNSWGSTVMSQALGDEIDRAAQEDILIVDAAGNSSANIDASPFYPASFNRPNQLTVAASASDDTLAWFSNYSRNSVHLAAPGANILSTLLDGTYGYMSGTSMAAPFVSGAAALVLSRCPMNTADLKTLLLNTVDPRPSFAGTTISGGRLNIASALQACALEVPNAAPSVALSAPLDGTAYSEGQTFTIAATAADSDGSIARVDFFAGVSMIGTATQAPYNVAVSNASPGTYAITAVASDNAGSQTRSDAATVTIGATAGAQSLPSPWQHQDVGTAGVAGSASYGGGAFSVQGAGGGLGGAADAFQYVYQPMTANGQIVAKVASVQTTGSRAQVGIMMRGDLSAESSGVDLDLRSDGTVEFVSRAANGVGSTIIATDSAMAPMWLKLARLNSVVYGYISTDGANWRALGKAVENSAPNYAGFGVSSSDASQLNTSTFGDVSVVGGTAPSTGGGNLPSPWASSEVGATGQTGAASFANGVFTVKGAGADVWGAADSFQYVHQAVSGDLSLVARITSQQSSSTFAKAGLMLRESLSSSAANVTLDMRPSGDFEFMTRSADGAAETFVATANLSLPAWVRLARSGSSVTASVSPDGSTWSDVGTTTFATSSAFAGLIVCSHDTSAMDTTTFDNVSIATGPVASALPGSWTSADVGATGRGGTASFANGSFTVKGAGADIWGSADSFQYVEQAVSGDLTLVARITSRQSANMFAKAGVMLRDSLAATAANVTLDVRPSGDFEFMTRSTDGGNETFLATANLPLPAWVRLLRTGSSVTASVSSDGNTWTDLGSTAFPTSSALAGLVVCSHTTAALDTVSFDNVAITNNETAPALPDSWTSADVGATGQTGAASFANGVFTVKGAGADIWGAADSFQYVNQAFSGDLTLVARVASQQSSSTFAKAGVMLRNSLAVGAANVTLDIRPGGDFEFMTRAADNAAETFLATARLPLPAWVRLVRSGSSVTASVSPDGIAWTTLGSTSFSPSSGLAGLVVCSHTTSAVSMVAFDRVSVAPGTP
jgi:subtilisin family serine protease/regulation of enolase protein 1 (concanavalin A-like superfamily)